jgi:hypothetical protein
MPDILRVTSDRYWPFVSVKEVLNVPNRNVRFAPESGHSESRWDRADVRLWPEADVG